MAIASPFRFVDPGHVRRGLFWQRLLVVGLSGFEFSDSSTVEAFDEQPDAQRELKCRDRKS
jgi:hypothetical protein